jgi:hypothetical protein
MGRSIGIVSRVGKLRLQDQMALTHEFKEW